jgi:hypothetical protein
LLLPLRRLTCLPQERCKIRFKLLLRSHIRRIGSVLG